jgi:uncharacterized membrane protein YcaP (DUF421 family)
MKAFYELIGEGVETLSMFQIGLRAAIVFFITILLIRVAGRRAFGFLSPFDNVMTILLGSTLGRAVVDGSMPFFNLLIAAGVIVVLQRLTAFVSMYVKPFASVVKGNPIELYANGQKNKKNMRRTMISEEDLMESVRKKGQVDTLDKIKTAQLDRDGSISITKPES